jgi:ParB family transcriptional regulator, chromosome partitioning protein
MAQKKNKPSSLAGKLRRDVFFGTSADLPKIVELDLDKIRQNPDQPRKRFDEETLSDLASSIEKHGLIQPITVKQEGEDSYLLVAGERRYRAHQILERQTIPAIITEGNADEIALIENIQREDLNALETAEAFQQMLERHSYTQEELGKVIGKAQNTVSEFLKLNSLPQQIKDEYRTSDNSAGITKSVLVEIAKLKTLDEQLKIWEAVKDGGLTVRVARAKKGETSSTVVKSSASQSLAAGRKFLRTLEGLRTNDLLTDQATRTELLAIRQQVDTILDSLWPG